MAVPSCALQVNGSFQTHFISESFNHLKTSLSSAAKPLFRELQQLPIKKVNNVSETMKNASGKILDALIISMFKFVDQPLLPSQKNFAPVEEIGSLVEINCTEGEIPPDFAEGVYIRNGNNPLFGGLKSAVSIFGQSHQCWVDGEGMLHAVYFKKDQHGSWIISYKNRYVETETFKLEKHIHNKPCFLPVLQGDASAVLAALLLNGLRFGAANKYFSNTNVFEHSGRVYSVTENYLPQEVDISTLETLSDWDVNGAWDRPFTGHPKKAPSSGELVIMGTDAKTPYYVLGVISADGKKLYKADLKFKRSVLSHDIGVTQKYNVIIDHPLTVDIQRLAMGGQLMKYEKEGYARIGVMPRYGDAESVKWFEVQTNCTFHILNCFEEGNEVVVRGCRALSSFIPGPDGGLNKYEWYSKGFNFEAPASKDLAAEVGYLLSRLYEWRLNMVTGQVKERNLTGTEFSMDFPFINEQVIGLKHKYGYTQVIDSIASSNSVYKTNQPTHR
ncbi:carotenoid 9 10(9 10)-cleavage dioxygenase 1 isoform X1 [Prunus yedoensis var. nudiflora]|uniref:Carotenoid 9 10(9 10)-cleavage dioxygenase 1 isoform X1 n=1 Tax=Prunus yedoensis var. nudiflora TaxID=2094558 RepID=A0A314Y782_PRUYE|nr:carotenoid 9 10(9 10)-cleavage dioxygenase 1 isoform X1 [Prunus yedoensis var. nudiflora]